MSLKRRSSPIFTASTPALTPDIPAKRAGLTKDQSIHVLQGMLASERRRHAKLMTLVLKTLDGVTNELVAARAAYFAQLQLQFRPTQSRKEQ